MLRIFITSNPLSTIFMSQYAKRTWRPGYQDVLCIDHYYKKKALISLIYESAALHAWAHIADFSIHIENEFNLKPTLREKIMRRVKNLPLIKGIYSRLLQKHQKNHARLLAGKMKDKLMALNIEPGGETEVYQLTQTALNAGAEELFPQARVFYMEHGTVDYIYVIEKQRKDGYICIFEENYKRYLAKRNIHFPVIECLGSEEFNQGFLDAAPGFKDAFGEIEKSSSKRYVLLLMDALEKFQLDENFWTDYVDRCLSEIKDPVSYLFIIKPHPMQSNEIIEITHNYFKQLGLSFVMLDQPGHISLSVESIYAYHKERIDHVFTTYSAAIFYLAHFYGTQSKFYHSYPFVSKYIARAPRQYRDSFKGLGPLIGEVFASKHLISLS